MQESRESDPGGLGRSSAGHFPIRGQASRLCLLTYFPHGSKPEYYGMETGAQGGLWSGARPCLPAAFSSP